MLVAAVVVGVPAGFLFRGGLDQPAPEGELPPRLRLREGQRSVWVSRVRNPWLTGLTVMSASGLLVVGVLSLFGRLAPGVAGSVLPALLIALAAGYATSSLTVRVTENGLAIGFGALGWPVRRIRLSKIDKAWSEERFPSHVGGWGFRGLPGSATIMLRGGECLVIRYRSGGQLVISIDDAQRAAALLNALIEDRANA